MDGNETTAEEVPRTPSGLGLVSSGESPGVDTCRTVQIQPLEVKRLGRRTDIQTLLSLIKSQRTPNFTLTFRLTISNPCCKSL